MRNAGLSELVLVQPGDWRTIDAWRTAWGAHDVLEGARVCATLAEAVADCTLVAAFTGRPQHGPWLDVRDAAQQARAHPGAVAWVFGPESSGLSDAEIASCGHAVCIPSDLAQPSLNLSHAVMVAVYELFRAAPASTVDGGELARHEEKQDALELLRTGLRAVGALPAQQERTRMAGWSALVQRMPLTPDEVKMLAHVARRMARRR
jgi:tRNA (cytidine32/uridine32-2'-O)-methyltransferase